MSIPWFNRIQAARRSRNRRNLFLGGGALASILLLGFVFNLTVPDRYGVAPRAPAPDFSALLPAGSVLDAGPLEMAASPQPSYAATYRTAGAAHVALAEWDRISAEYRLGPAIALTEGDATLERAGRLELQPIGAGDPLLVASGPLGAYTEGVFLLARDAQGLGIVRLTDEEGKSGPAFFLVGASAMHSEELDFADLDADGRSEAIAVSRESTEQGVARTAARAYRFRDGAFFYDSDLSKMMTISKSLFPEPPASEQSGASVN